MPRPSGFSVAFALREREIDAVLCDGLDAAIREVGDAGALSDAAAERARNAADLVRDLAARINDMIARSIDAETEAATMDEARSQTASEHDAPPRLAFFEAAVMESESFAQAVATLVASLPTIADAAGPAADMPGEQPIRLRRPQISWMKPTFRPPRRIPEPVGEGVTDVVVLFEAAAPTEALAVESLPVLCAPAASEEPGAPIEPPQAEAFVVEPLPVVCKPAAFEEPGAPIEPPQAEAFVVEPLAVVCEPAAFEEPGAPNKSPQAEAFVVEPLPVLCEPAAFEEPSAPIEPPQAEAFVAEPLPVLCEPAAFEEPSAPIEPPQAESFVVEPLPVLCEPAATEAASAPIEPPQAESFVVEPLPVLCEPAATEAASAPFNSPQAEAFVIDARPPEPFAQSKRRLSKRTCRRAGWRSCERRAAWVRDGRRRGTRAGTP